MAGMGFSLVPHLQTRLSNLQSHSHIRPLTNWRALNEWVACMAWGAAANGVVIDHLTPGVDAACAGTGVNAFLVNTRLVQGTF